jgi:hypothetical protein
MALSLTHLETVKIPDTSVELMGWFAHTESSLDLTAQQSRLDGKLSSAQCACELKNAGKSI